MATVIKIIGILIILMAILYLIKPDALKWLINFIKKGKRIYFIALLRFALAVLFLLAARDCYIPAGIIAFGILFIISGSLILILGAEKIRTILEWYLKQSALFLRILALIALAIGALIIYFA